MGGVRRALEKLRGARHIEWALIAFALAAALLVASEPREQAEPGGSELERRMEAVLSGVKGAGEVRVLVNRAETAFASADTPVTGVLVVAEGAGDVRVALELQRAVRALLGVEAEQIEILTLEEEDS